MDRRPLLSGQRESSRRPPPASPLFSQSTAAPPQPLLPASQLDSTLIVFEDDITGDALHVGESAGGPGSDARTSIFSSFSLSAWSDGAAAVGGPRGAALSTSVHSPCMTAFLRPFQRLRRWCCGGERGQDGCCALPSCWRCGGWCCCCCCRRDGAGSESDFYEGDNEDFDSPVVGRDAVAADALRASGVSHGSSRSKGGTPTTIPHRGRSSSSAGVADNNNTGNTADRNNIHNATTGGSSGGNGSRQHRQYAPPRSRSSEGGFGGASTPTPAESVGGEGETVAGAGSVGESSLAGSSTPPSSIAFGRVPTAPGEQLVMQHGVLMRIAPDGSCTRVEDASPQSGGGAGGGSGNSGGGLMGRSPRQPGLDDGRARSPVAQPALLTTTAASPFYPDSDVRPFPGGNAGAAAEEAARNDANNSYAVAMALHALESSRQSLRSLEQLTSVLARLAPYLPLRVEVELDINSSSTLLPAVPPGQSTSSAAAGAAATASPTSPAAPPAISLCVHVLGPLQSCSTPAALRLLEDIFLEDCDTHRLNLNALHCADVDLRNVVAGVDESPLGLMGRPNSSGLSGNGSGIRDSPGAEDGRLRAHSNAYLDLLVSPVTRAEAGRTAANSYSRDGRAGESGVRDDTGLSAAAAARHVLAFLSNFVKGRGTQLTTLHFTRCFMVPHDMGRLVPLPLRTVRRLRYEHCALTPAHVDALLMLARQQDGERRRNGSGNSSSGVDGGGGRGGVSATRGAVSFGVLEELQLSGPLTSECVAELLDYVEDQQLAVTEGSGAPVALRQLVVPSALVRAVREHPFVQANYQRLSVVSAH